LARLWSGLYEQMPEPKYGDRMGACTITGGIVQRRFHHAVRGGWTSFIPVDLLNISRLFPPRPEAI